jgi:phospholipid transport system substrate-binding protein
MYTNYFRRLILLIIPAFTFSVALPLTVSAGELADRVNKATDKLIEIFSDQTLDAPEMEEKRISMIRDAVDEIFDWEAFSRRTMGRHWRKLSPDEKNEFVSLFGRLLERTYLYKIKHYSGESIVFLNEKIDEKYGKLKAKIITENGTDIPLDYHMIKKNGTWFVYDVHIEGVSFVNNYRTQFNNILTKSSYKELKKLLESKLEEESEAQ